MPGAVQPQKSVHTDFKCMLRHKRLVKKNWVREWWGHFFELHSEGSELICDVAKFNAPTEKFKSFVRVFLEIVPHIFFIARQKV